MCIFLYFTIYLPLCQCDEKIKIYIFVKKFYKSTCNFEKVYVIMRWLIKTHVAKCKCEITPHPSAEPTPSYTRTPTPTTKNPTPTKERSEDPLRAERGTPTTGEGKQTRKQELYRARENHCSVKTVMEEKYD